MDNRKEYNKKYFQKLKAEEVYCEACRINVKLSSMPNHIKTKKHIQYSNMPKNDKEIEENNFIKDVIDKYLGGKMTKKEFITEIGSLYEDMNVEEDKEYEETKYTEPKTTTAVEKEFCNQTVHLMIMDLGNLIDDNSHIPDEMESELKSIERTKDEINSKIRLFNLYKRMNNFLNPQHKHVGEVIEQKIKTINEPIIKPILKKVVEIVEPMDDDEIDDRDPELISRENDFIPVSRFYKLSPEEQERKIGELMNGYDYFLGGYISNIEDEFLTIENENEDGNNFFDMYRRIVHYRNIREEEMAEARMAEEDDEDAFDTGF
jgi:hypothetical protein